LNEVVSAFKYEDKSHLHAVMHVKNAILNLQCDLIVSQQENAKLRIENSNLINRFAEFASKKHIENDNMELITKIDQHQQTNFLTTLFPDGEPIKLYDESKQELIDAFYSGMPANEIMQMINNKLNIDINE